MWPGGPGLPRGPAPPDSPGGPLSPGDPTAPGEPRCPVNPVGPVAPVAPVAPDGPGGPETFKQRHTLLHLIRYLELYSGLDLGLAHILGLACTQNYILHFVIQDGWLSPTEPASVYAHFGLPGYAPGTIAVNVTWTEI